MKTNLLKYSYTFLLLLFVVSCSDEEEETPLSSNELSITEEILNLVNQHRQSQGLSTLQSNATAVLLAEDHTRYMISLEELNHHNLDAKFQTLIEKEGATGIGENVASFYPDAASVVTGWLNSPDHRRNIEGNFTHTGIAAIKDEEGKYYYTQIFYR